MQTSNAGTKYMLTLATAHLTVLQGRLAHAQTMTEVEVSYDFGKGRYEGRRYVHDQKRVLVVKGAKFQTVFHDGTVSEYVQDGVEVLTGEGPHAQRRTFVFENEQKRIVNNLTGNIASVESDIKFLGEKIVEWKP